MTNLSPFLDFLIAFVYVLALCSTVMSLCYEMISYWLKTRATFLHKVLEDVLNDTLANDINFANLIYDFPVIDFTKKMRTVKPMYISSSNFAKSLVHAYNDFFAKQHLIVPPNGGAKVVDPALPTTPAALFEVAVKQLKDSKLKTLLETFINSAGGDYDKLLKNVETWYNDYMDRVTGWFKVRSQKRMIFVALPLAIIFNLNFLNIGRKLFTDKTQTAVLVNMAENWKPVSGDTVITTANDFQKAMQLKTQTIDSIQKANVPMWWAQSDVNEFRTRWWWCILGWLLMAVAMVMGAPFWYDLLNKFVNMRKAGMKPNTDTSKTSN